MATCDTPDCYGNLVYWGLATEPEFSLTLTVPIERTFWQWLRRKPRQYRAIHVPHATLAETPVATEEELNDGH